MGIRGKSIPGSGTASAKALSSDLQGVESVIVPDCIPSTWTSTWNQRLFNKDCKNESPAVGFRNSSLK